jgi:hypothetical protein
MSMTRFQLEGLHLLGYTRRESEFLFLVATHSGYFTTRQFKSFARTESGSISHAFIRKLLTHKHASYHAYRSGGRVYHVFARKVYQAIERENLRTRKKHELEYVKTRLVTLDFVLGHAQHHYLETEREKVVFLANQYNVGLDILPVKQYRAKKSADVTPRYFVDRFPMFVSSTWATPTLTFTYVDAGAVTLDGLGTHLRGYLQLFRALPRFEFMYIAPSSRLFQAAESEFRHLLYGQRGPSTSVNILDYFRLRKAWDAKERVASADVVLLKEAQQRYAGSRLENLYGEWRQGIAGDKDVTRIADHSAEPTKTIFRTLVCGASLKVFSDPLGCDAESSLEKDGAREVDQDAGQSSNQVSGS